MKERLNQEKSPEEKDQPAALMIIVETAIF